MVILSFLVLAENSNPTGVKKKERPLVFPPDRERQIRGMFLKHFSDPKSIGEPIIPLGNLLERLDMICPHDSSVLDISAVLVAQNGATQWTLPPTPGPLNVPSTPAQGCCIRDLKVATEQGMEV